MKTVRSATTTCRRLARALPVGVLSFTCVIGCGGSAISNKVDLLGKVPPADLQRIQALVQKAGYSGDVIACEDLGGHWLVTLRHQGDNARPVEAKAKDGDTVQSGLPALRPPIRLLVDEKGNVEPAI